MKVSISSLAAPCSGMSIASDALLARYILDGEPFIDNATAALL